ncbi:MAG: glycosyltransferase [Proteobacteria bacterium]|nr:glycosyltransferase [Pseudomonadota bacterium]
MRVAIVHDWLVGMRGGERCLEIITEIIPNADIYTLFLERDNLSPALQAQKIYPSVLQKLPFVNKYYRYLLPFYKFAVEDINQKLQAEKYDLVISISHCVAKNITPPRGAYHLCYCLTPARYFFDHYETYFSGKKLEPLIRQVVSYLRKWDLEKVVSVDKFCAISNFVKERIANIYKRDAEVVYPPVRQDWPAANIKTNNPQGFLCVSALVPYKNVELIVDAFNVLSLPLTIVGSGPEEKKLKKKAKNNIKFVDFVDDEELSDIYAGAQAFVFAAKEDFGITPVEAQAHGKPVVCFGEGAVLETVVGKGPESTGVFFYDLSVEGLIDAVKHFYHRQEEITVDNCLRQAEKFSVEIFKDNFRELLKDSGFEFNCADDPIPNSLLANVGKIKG